MSELKIYRFGSTTDGNASMKDVLGGKGANLAEMSSLGMPVPPGFTIPCSASVDYNSGPLGGEFALMQQVTELVKSGITYLVGGAGKSPLMSVRSGARVSMPGMMDTILNVGLCTSTLDYWTDKLGAVAALDSYRRLIQMYSSVALGVDLKLFEDALEAMRQDAGVKTDSELNEDQLSRLVKRYLKIVSDHGLTFPDTPFDQVMGAIVAVFKSWNNPRAVEYRKINKIPQEWGTAVTVQSMVFGNLNDKSATGVVFTRDPSTGANVVTGEFLVNAQGEDVVAGIRTPEPITKMSGWNPKAYQELLAVLGKLEDHYKDMQDVEFTVEDGKLYMLQTRNGKRSAMAAFQVAYDLANEGQITKEVAASRVTKAQLFSVMQDSIDPKFKGAADFTGIAAGGGIVKGVATFTSENAVNCKTACILATPETDPDDIAGMNASVGILTATGGLTSHAAVVARGMNKTCVVGATSLSFSGGKSAYVNGKPAFVEGDMLTIDGATGRVWVKTQVPLIAGGASPIVRAVISWGQATTLADRIELSPLMSSSAIAEAVSASTSASVYIDTVTLEGSDRFVEHNSVMVRLAAVGDALTTSKATEVVVDLSGREEHYSRGDSAFDLMFGLTASTSAAMAQAKVDALLNWPKASQIKTTVRLDETGSKFAEDLRGMGFKVSGHVLTFADLLNASGPMSVSSEVIAYVFGSKEAYAIAVEAVAKINGKTTHKPLPVPGYWYEAITMKA